MSFVKITVSANLCKFSSGGSCILTFTLGSRLNGHAPALNSRMTGSLRNVSAQEVSLGRLSCGGRAGQGASRQLASTQCSLGALCWNGLAGV